MILPVAGVRPRSDAMLGECFNNEKNCEMNIEIGWLLWPRHLLSSRRKTFVCVLRTNLEPSGIQYNNHILNIYPCLKYFRIRVTFSFDG